MTGSWVSIDHALHIAAMRGLPGAVSVLLKHGATVDATSLCGDTPMGIAALFGRTKCVKLLLRAGANVNGAIDGASPLLQASTSGALECIRVTSIAALWA